VVSTHGRLQQASWIHHTGVSLRQDSQHHSHSTYTTQLNTELTFQRVDTPVPSVVRQAPNNCTVYIATSPLNKTPVPVIKKNETSPPPVPPKPQHLPSLNTISHSRMTSDILLPPRIKRDVITPPPRPKRNVNTPRTVPPVPLKKPQIIVSNGSVVAVKRYAARNTTSDDAVRGTEVDTSFDDSSEQNNESTRTVGGAVDNENQSLNYNISACSTVEWVYSEHKNVLVNNHNTVEENPYEPVTPVDNQPISNGVHVGVEQISNVTPVDSQPLYSVVNKDKTNKKCVTNMSDTLVGIIQQFTGDLSVTMVMDKASVGNDAMKRLSVSSEAGLSAVWQPVKRSSSYGDLPRQTSYTVDQSLSNESWWIVPPLPHKSELTGSHSLNQSKVLEKSWSTDPQLPKKSWLKDGCECDNSSVDYYEDIDLCRSRSIRSVRSYVEAQSAQVSVNDGCRTLRQGTLLVSECVDACPLSSDVTQNNENLFPYLDTVLSFDPSGAAFYVPKSLIVKYGSPEQEPWFYPLPLTPLQATIFLSEEKLEGCFLVYRPVLVEDCVMYHLSVCRDTGDVLHYRIVENLHGDYSIVGHDHSFLTISELVHYFQCNKSTLATRLRRPLAHARLPVTPGLHYDGKYELNRSDLTLTGRIIGKGNFGVICAGIHQNKHVAVKVSCVLVFIKRVSSTLVNRITKFYEVQLSLLCRP